MSLIDALWGANFNRISDIWTNTGFLILTILITIFLLCVCFLIHSGIFRKIEVLTKESPHDEMTVAYKTGIGPYKGASMLCNEVMSLLEQNKLNQNNLSTEVVETKNPLVIGLYYDDPESVPEDELRYAVGAVLSRGKESADAQALESMISQGYKITVFPKPAYVVTASFPVKTRLSLYIAIFRVYPRLREYINIKGLCAYPAIEFYSQDQLQFVMPLSKQEEFFVPEFCEEQVSIATTEFSTQAPSETNKSYLTGFDETGSVSGAGSVHEDSNLDISASGLRHTPDRRVKEDFGGDDQISLESESEGFTTEEDEHVDRVFIKPTKPAPRRKQLSQKRKSENNSDFIKENEIVDREVLEPQTNDSNNDNAGDLNQELIKVRSCNLDAMSASENSSMEDLTQSFVQVENSQE